METSAGARRSIGIGLVGVGWMGRLHSKSYHQVNYHYPQLGVRPRLVVAADTAPDRVRFAIDELGYLEGTDDWRSVIAHPDVEAVNIAAPNYLHREIATLAAEQGKHFWIEKPVGRNVDETEDIARAARAAGIVTAVGFCYRHAPAVQHARELVCSGGIGKLVHVRGVFLNDYAAEPRAALSWRFQRSLAGLGVVGDLMSHTIDLLQHLVGPIAETSALTKIVIPMRPVLPMGVGDHFAVVEGGKMGAVENEDYAGALLRFGDGAVGTCEVSRVTVGPRCQIALDVFGTDGALSWDFERMNELRVCLGRSGADHGYTTVLAGPDHGDYAHFQPGPAISMSYDDLKVIEAALFLQSISEGKQLGAVVADAAATARVLAAVARSAGSGRWESVEQRRAEEVN